MKKVLSKILSCVLAAILISAYLCTAVSADTRIDKVEIYYDTWSAHLTPSNNYFTFRDKLKGAMHPDSYGYEDTDLPYYISNVKLLVMFDEETGNYAETNSTFSTQNIWPDKKHGLKYYVKARDGYCFDKNSIPDITVNGITPAYIERPEVTDEKLLEFEMFLPVEEASAQKVASVEIQKFKIVPLSGQTYSADNVDVYFKFFPGKVTQTTFTVGGADVIGKKAKKGDKLTIAIRVELTGATYIDKPIAYLNYERENEAVKLSDTACVFKWNFKIEETKDIKITNQSPETVEYNYGDTFDLFVEAEGANTYRWLAFKEDAAEALKEISGIYETGKEIGSLSSGSITTGNTITATELDSSSYTSGKEKTGFSSKYDLYEGLSAALDINEDDLEVAGSNNNMKTFRIYDADETYDGKKYICCVSDAGAEIYSKPITLKMNEESYEKAMQEKKEKQDKLDARPKIDKIDLLYSFPKEGGYYTKDVELPENIPGHIYGVDWNKGILNIMGDKAKNGDEATLRVEISIDEDYQFSDDPKVYIDGVLADYCGETGTNRREFKWDIKIGDENYSKKTESVSWSNASDWALAELEKANKASLIPGIFEGEDLTKNITRREFAHIAVKLYEHLTGVLVLPSKNPFNDTDDTEVLKAYGIGITFGTSDTTFSPDSPITREQMATMLTRALKISGIDTDVDLSKVEKFSDDKLMNDWGRDAIYFMSQSGIILGMGDGSFGTLGNATREQALLISVRSAEKFKK